MNKQVEQIRAEVYRRFVEAGIHEGMIAETREDELNSLLSFIDSMPEDPKFKIGDRVRYKGHQCDGVITAITDTDYICGNVKLPISTQDEMEFVEETVSKFDAAIQDGDDVRYNEDFGCRVNLSQLHRVAQRDRLNQFYNEFDEIIKPYKNSHNYKNLCISLVAWKQNFWRWLLWKAEKVSGKLTQSVTKTSDQVMPVSDDLEKEIDRWSKEQCYNKSEKPAFAAVARHFAQWQKQQIMKDAVDIIPFDINPNYGIACFWIEKQSGEVLKIESSWLISQGIEVNKKIKLITIKEDLI